MTPDLLPRNFTAKIQVNDRGCWIFTGAVQSSGYGSIAIDGDGSTRLAHRAAYELLVDRIPAGLTIDHLCMVKRCCNPAHLEVVTIAENCRRAREAGLIPFPPHAAANAAKTHCKRGHEFTEENTRLNRQGWRVCVECRRAADRRRKLRVIRIKSSAVAVSA